MLSLLRAGVVAVLVSIVSLHSFSAQAADKPFQRDDLADAAIKLEAQIKSDAGPVTKPVATLRHDADAAFQRNDFRAGIQLLGQIVAAAPDDSTNWLRLAHTILQIHPTDDRERRLLAERATAAAYVAYQRSKNRNEEADALVLLSRVFADRNLWRPALDTLRLSLELREVAEVRANYERMRGDHGFRLLDYSVDADSSTPRACFQFSEALPGRRMDFSPFVSVEGQDKPALSTDDKQLCVEGLKHGERYSVTLRAGLPSVVKETLAKSADFTIYVRDRKPFVHFSGKAYVLPRTGQRGIPVISVNTKSVAIEIYRIGDRNLLGTVLGRDFQTNLEHYELDRLANRSGTRVWQGELKVEPTLNAEITTAFPVDEAVGTLSPGVYVMAAEPAGTPKDSYEALATQWFIVSDLGLTAFSGNDGIHVFVHSLASAGVKASTEIRLLGRNNEVLATRKSDSAGQALFEPGLVRGEGGLEPALLVASDDNGDYAFLNLNAQAFDLSDRGVNGRATPPGLDAFVYTERGVYRTGETVHITALARDGRGVAAPGIPLTLVVDRPDGVEYRRVTVADQGVGGRTFDLPISTSASSGTWRVSAYVDPKQPQVGETTFMVEDYVPDRLEFSLATKATGISKSAPVEVSVDGRYLYGAPASSLELDGEVNVRPVASRPGFAGYQFGLADEEDSSAKAQQTLEALPPTNDKGAASFKVVLDKIPETTRPLEAQVTVRMAETGGRAVERQLTIPVTPSGTMVGVKPLFSGRSLGEGESANFDVVLVTPDGKALARQGMHYELLKIETRYQWYRQ